MICKNKRQVEVGVEIRNTGNWNYKNNSSPVCTKPIAVIKIDGDEFVFSHEDILKILDAYHQVDLESIRMIQNKLSGDVIGLDIKFIEKIKNWITEKSPNKPNPYFKNGQTSLRS